MNILKYIDTCFAQLSIFLIKIYQYTISPDKGIFSPVLKGTVCAHHPHCSEYSVRTFQRYGFIHGIGKVMNRVTSCTPSRTVKYDPEYYKVVFFSSAPIGVPFLEELQRDKRFDIVGVVTNPDQKSGRGMQLKENIIKTTAKQIQGKNNLDKPNLLLLHGYNSSADQNFFQNLKQKAEKEGIKTTVFNLPNSDNPNIPEQTQYVLDNYTFDENTIILGHSLGSVIGLNVIQQLSTKIKQYISVAGFLNDNLHIDRRYFNTFDFEFDQKKILGNLSEKTIIIYDPKDKNIPMTQSALLEKFFGAKRITLPTQKPHYLGEKEEELCEYIKKEIDKESNNKQKVILLHGKNTNSQEKWYPRVKKELEKNGYVVDCPDLPNADDPDIEERKKEIDKLLPDEETIVIGHSRGGVAILRRLEENNQTVKKIILVGANDGKSKYISHGGNNKGFYTKQGYNFEEIKKKCKEFVIFHSKDDKWVKCQYGLNNAQGLNAKLYTFEDKNHFGENNKYGYKAQTFPQLVNEIFYGDPYFTFIQTPTSLRLDSKKYAEEAHNFKLWLEAKNPDYLVVIAYGKIIPQYILDIPNIAPINIHGSLLPKYRGASPIQSVFLNNEIESGITIMKMDATMDTGNMIDTLKTKLKFDWNTLDLIERMKQKGPNSLNTTLRNYGKNLLGEETQHNKEATYCEKINKSEGEINPYTDTLQEVYNKYRAYYLWPKIYFPIKKNEKTIICTIDNLVLDEKIFKEQGEKPLLSENNTLHPAIKEIKIKPQGKKAMDWKSFVNGYLK